MNLFLKATTDSGEFMFQLLAVLMFISDTLYVPYLISFSWKGFLINHYFADLMKIANTLTVDIGSIKLISIACGKTAGIPSATKLVLSSTPLVTIAWIL